MAGLGCLAPCPSPAGHQEPTGGGGSPVRCWGCSASPAWLGVAFLEKYSLFKHQTPWKIIQRGWLGEQSRCLEGTVLFEMLLKALDDSQQQLEGISSW